MRIVFNKPYFTGKETRYIEEAVQQGKISGDGPFTQKCHEYFQTRFGFKKCLLTTSCTDALEMAAILINTQAGDEIIMPAFTFVSTANAFVLRGARIVFTDSRADYPGMDEHSIEALITPNTKAIVVVHYGGISCDMDVITALARKYQLYVIEDAANAIDSYYIGHDHTYRPLGSIGHLGTFSFHETKNIISGEGGMLIVNDERFFERAEIIREKGTNRSKFFRGEVDKYEWVDIGSSFLPSDITAAFLYAQLECLDQIQQRRKKIWNIYYEKLAPLKANGRLQLPSLPPYATNNAQMFYVVCRNMTERTLLTDYLNKHGILAVFHYQNLAQSPYYAQKHDGRHLPMAERYSHCLLRLPIYYELSVDEAEIVADTILRFYRTYT